MPDVANIFNPNDDAQAARVIQSLEANRDHGTPLTALAQNAVAQFNAQVIEHETVRAGDVLGANGNPVGVAMAEADEQGWVNIMTPNGELRTPGSDLQKMRLDRRALTEFRQQYQNEPYTEEDASDRYVTQDASVVGREAALPRRRENGRIGERYRELYDAISNGAFGIEGPEPLENIELNQGLGPLPRTTDPRDPASEYYEGEVSELPTRPVGCKPVVSRPKRKLLRRKKKDG